MRWCAPMLQYGMSLHVSSSTSASACQADTSQQRIESIPAHPQGRLLMSCPCVGSPTKRTEGVLQHVMLLRVPRCPPLAAARPEGEVAAVPLHPQGPGSKNHCALCGRRPWRYTARAALRRCRRFSRRPARSAASWVSAHLDSHVALAQHAHLHPACRSCKVSSLSPLRSPRSPWWV